MVAVLEGAIDDAKHLTSPPSPPRKQKVSEKRTRPSNERKRLFHDEDEMDTSEPSKITQDILFLIHNAGLNCRVQRSGTRSI